MQHLSRPEHHLQAVLSCGGNGGYCNICGPSACRLLILCRQPPSAGGLKECIPGSAPPLPLRDSYNNSTSSL